MAKTIILTEREIMRCNLFFQLLVNEYPSDKKTIAKLFDIVDNYVTAQTKKYENTKRTTT